MDNKQIKTLLKAAREAIRNKEFKDALRHCKAVLTEDKENYMALVLVAVGAEGLEQNEQALKAYKRAIIADGSQLLAWQGLSSFYEKHESPEYISDRFDVYMKLIELHKEDEEKRHDCLVKISKLVTQQTEADMVEKVVSVLMDAVKVESVLDRKTALQQTLLNILKLSKIPDKKQKIHTLCEEVIEKSTEYDDNLETFIALYLSGVSEMEPCNVKATVFSDIYRRFPDSNTALKYSLLHQLDKFIVLIFSKDMQINKDFEAMVNSYDGRKNSEGAVLDASKGFLALCGKDYMTARKHFCNAANHSTNIVSTHVFLAWTSLQLHQIETASTVCQQGLNVLKQKDRLLMIPAQEVTNVLYNIQARALYSTSNKMSLMKSLEIVQTELNLEDKQIIVMKGLIHIKLKDIESAKACLVDAMSMSALLEGLILEEENKYKEASESYQRAVQMDPHNATFLLHLAICQFKMEDLKQESFGNLLKAAKQDPYDAIIFLYLGHYYRQQTTDTTRARKCYQKAFDLDPQNDEAGQALCDVLNANGEEEQANKILISVTTKASAGCAKWAWLRLGLYQLQHDDPSVAIGSLQAALRADPTDVHVWECLGEAYFSRGSYTAALKAFNKASELSPDSMYCLYQMASIKQTLAMYTEAVEEYQLILVKSHNYVPALKGLGETYNLMAKSYLNRYLHGRARDKCQEALQVLLKAASMRPDLSCLWKLAGDSCTMLHELPSENFRFEKTEQKSLNKLETLQFGERFYIKAVKIVPECSSLWHDLGLNYLYQSRCLENDSQLLEKAAQSMKKAVELEPANHRHWTALGFIACSEGNYKPELAQHCFIKSVQVENSNVVAWTNLATLYLKHDNVKLAHEAFKIAQSLEPSYVSCWIGQAIIAELVRHEDAMDLFRHTTDLGNHLEGALGYAHWVCTLLKSKDTHESYVYQYAIEQMAAVPASIDALAKYTDRGKTNPIAYNMYGLLLERQKLYRTAAIQFKQALELLDSQQDERFQEVTCNYARVLCACGEFEESGNLYETIQTVSSFEDLCQSALAFYKWGKLEQSFQAYTKAAELAPTVADKSHVLSAVAMVIYKFGNTESTKTKLFESAQMEEPSVHGLEALCALGLIQSDETLAMAALQELHKLEGTIDQKHRKDLGLLAMCASHLKGSDVEGLRQIEKLLIQNPCDPDLWKLLSTVLLLYFPKKGRAIEKCAGTALLLDKQNKQNVYTMMSLGQMSGGFHSRKNADHSALTTAQRAVFLYPDKVENWACLALAIHTEAILCSDQSQRQVFFEQELNILTNILSRENISLGLKLWCLKQKTALGIHSHNSTEYLGSLESLLEEFNTKEVQQFFDVFHNVVKGSADSVLKTAKDSDDLNYWEIVLEMYIQKGLYLEAEQTLLQYVTSMNRDKDELTVMLMRMAHGLFMALNDNITDVDPDKFDELAHQILSLEPDSPALLTMQGVCNLNKKNRK